MLLRLQEVNSKMSSKYCCMFETRFHVAEEVLSQTLFDVAEC